jgi:hypothetical protein
LDALQFSKEVQAGLDGHRFDPSRGILPPVPPGICRSRARFVCSRYSTQEFRRRHRLAVRRPAFKRRRAATQEEIADFIA